MPVEEGQYRARAIKAAGKLNEEETNAAINILFQVYEKSLGGGMYEPADGTIYGSFWLLKKSDGGMVHNDFTIKSLQEAFGWDGQDPDWFVDAINGQECRITTEWETYEGKNRLRVKWLNPAAGMKPPTAEERQSVTTLFKQLVSGGAPSTAATPAKPARPTRPKRADAVAPTSPAKPAADVPPGRVAPPAKKVWTYADTMTALRTWMPGKDQAAVDAKWWEIMDSLFPQVSEANRMKPTSDMCLKFIESGKSLVANPVDGIPF